MLKRISELYPEFSLKVGKKAGTVIVEMGINGFKPFVVLGKDLDALVREAHVGALHNAANGLLEESRKSEEEFDRKVEQMEFSPCCCCSGCDDEDEDEEEDFYDDDDDEEE